VSGPGRMHGGGDRDLAAEFVRFIRLDLADAGGFCRMPGIKSLSTVSVLPVEDVGLA
jgi:hypothetical protein